MFIIRILLIFLFVFGTYNPTVCLCRNPENQFALPEDAQ